MCEQLIESLIALCVFGSICLFFVSLYLGYKIIMSLFTYDNKDYKSKYENLKKEIEDKKAYENGFKEGLKHGRKNKNLY